MEKSEPKGGAPVVRDPSYPDRARIDSDVRAFLRPASSPWIVFDRESKADFGGRALRIGAVFASNPDIAPPGRTPTLPVVSPEAFAPTVIQNVPAAAAEAQSPMFPPSTHEQAAEPSSLVAMTEIPAPAIERQRSFLESDFSVPGLIPSKRAPWAVAACVAVAALVAVGAGALYKHRPAAPPVQATAAAVIAPPPAPEPEPRDEIVPPPPVAAAAPAQSPGEAVGQMSNDPKKRFGRLTIKASKNVWFDGKKMLGNGQRSFMVFCGMHQVAIGEKTDNRDVEVPCNGEYTVK